ncbi:hypothetical protein ACQ4PT_032845 [Festuca glaucescens]
MDANEIGQYAIDEHILKETMGEVALFKEKLLTHSKLDPSQIVWIAMCLPMLATIYMDFLSFPPLGPKEHNINPSTPRFCYVCDEDFRLVVEIDKNKLSLDPAAFGDRPLLPLSETLYVVVAPANAHRPYVDPAVGGDDGMSSEEVEVNPSASLNEWLEKGLASSQELQVPEHLQGLYKKHQDLDATDIGAALHNFGQFLKAANAKRMAALLVDVHVANVASSSFTIPCPAAPDVHAKDPSPIMVEEDAIVENVVIDQALDIGEASHMARREPSRVPSRVPSPDPSRVASPVPFTEPTEPSRVASPEHSRVPSAEHTPVPSPEHSRVPSRVPSPEHSLVASPASSEDFEPTIASPTVFKPRQYMDNQVMSLFVEKFNIENHMQATRNKRSRKKFAFSVQMTSELIKDPAKFQTKDVIVEFKNACDRYKISKMDLITNFGALAQETQAFSFDITKLKRGGPADYTQQPNLFDCGFFTILYMDKFDGKVMENFDENGIPYFRMILATNLIDHPHEHRRFCQGL